MEYSIISNGGDIQEISSLISGDNHIEISTIPQEASHVTVLSMPYSISGGNNLLEMSSMPYQNADNVEVVSDTPYLISHEEYFTETRRPHSTYYEYVEVEDSQPQYTLSQYNTKPYQPCITMLDGMQHISQNNDVEYAVYNDSSANRERRLLNGGKHLTSNVTMKTVRNIQNDHDKVVKPNGIPHITSKNTTTVQVFENDPCTTSESLNISNSSSFGKTVTKTNDMKISDKRNIKELNGPHLNTTSNTLCHEKSDSKHTNLVNGGQKQLTLKTQTNSQDGQNKITNVNGDPHLTLKDNNVKEVDNVPHTISGAQYIELKIGVQNSGSQEKSIMSTKNIKVSKTENMYSTNNGTNINTPCLINSENISSSTSESLVNNPKETFNAVKSISLKKDQTVNSTSDIKKAVIDMTISKPENMSHNTNETNINSYSLINQKNITCSTSGSSIKNPSEKINMKSNSIQKTGETMQSSSESKKTVNSTSTECSRTNEFVRLYFEERRIRLSEEFRILFPDVKILNGSTLSLTVSGRKVCVTLGCFHCSVIDYSRFSLENKPREIRFVLIDEHYYLICSFCCHLRNWNFQQLFNDTICLKQISYFCKWNCGIDVTLNKLYDHEKKCNLQLLQTCPMKSCKDRLKFCDLFNHLKEHHPEFRPLSGYFIYMFYGGTIFFLKCDKSPQRLIFVQSNIPIFVEFNWDGSFWKVDLSCKIPNVNLRAVIMDSKHKLVAFVKKSGTIPHSNQISIKCFLADPKKAEDDIPCTNMSALQQC